MSSSMANRVSVIEFIRVQISIPILVIQKTMATTKTTILIVGRISIAHQIASTRFCARKDMLLIAIKIDVFRSEMWMYVQNITIV
jgi:hypothetical protein